MTIHCIGDCGATYIQNFHGPVSDDSLIAAGWEHTHTGWLCDECTQPAGLCPICGSPVTIIGGTSDDRFIGSCGDAFSRQKWEEE